ncbi:MAG: hypothetical protein ACXWWD_05755 [Chitinophagaceae bacterium]
MHDKKAYEQTITSKLEALPVPDMADAIWTRIEAQLDLDMPEDDGGGNNNPPSSPRSGWLGKAGIVLFVAAFVLSIFLYRSRKNTVVAPGTTITNKNSVNDSVSVINNGSPPSESKKENGVPGITTQIPEAGANSLDTTLNLLTNPLQDKADTAQQYTGIPAPPVKTIADTVTPKQKGRGVQGITDEEYRIKPKNDSTP